MQHINGMNLGLHWAKNKRNIYCYAQLGLLGKGIAIKYMGSEVFVPVWPLVVINRPLRY